MSIGPVQYLIGAMGAGLLVAAVSNRNPLDVARSALSGSGEVRALVPPPAPVESDAPPTSTGPTTRLGRRVLAAGIGSTGPATPADLAPLDQGSHRLRPAAVAAFRQWEQAFGRDIPITDSWRSYERQAQSHENDRARFASPDRSWHVKGLAVDVNLPAIGSTSGVLNSGDDTYDRLYRAARATGWDTYSDGKAGAHTWHFSFGGRG